MSLVLPLPIILSLARQRVDGLADSGPSTPTIEELGADRNQISTANVMSGVNGLLPDKSWRSELGLYPSLDGAACPMLKRYKVRGPLE